MDSLDLIVLLMRYKRTILSVTLAVTVLASIITFIVPNTYTASTTFFPPLENGPTNIAGLGQSETPTELSAAALGEIDPTALCISMLKSHSVQNAIVDQFDLRRVYSIKRHEDAREHLDHKTEILADKEGQISINVSDRDPDRAARIAEAYVEQLHALYQTFARSEASQRRTFYENQVAVERNEMSLAEASLRQAQEQTGLIHPDAQTQAIIDSVARTRAQIAVAEATLQTMRLYATPNNPDLQRAEAELAGIREQLAKVERSGNLAIPASRLPQVQLEYSRRARNLKYHETLYQFLSKQAGEARLDEDQQGAW